MLVWFQPAVRQSATQTLNMWIEQTGLPVFVEAEIMTDALKLENPILRAEVCTDDYVIVYFAYRMQQNSNNID